MGVADGRWGGGPPPGAIRAAWTAAARSRPGRRTRERRSLFLRRFLFLLEVVLHAEDLARAIVDLLGRVLGVLQLGQPLLDLGQLLLDLTVQVGDLLAGHVERRLVELGLVFRE